VDRGQKPEKTGRGKGKIGGSMAPETKIATGVALWGVVGKGEAVSWKRGNETPIRKHAERVFSKEARAC